MGFGLCELILTMELIYGFCLMCRESEWLGLVHLMIYFNLKFVIKMVIMGRVLA